MWGLVTLRIRPLLLALEVVLVQLLELTSTPCSATDAEHDGVGHPQAVAGADGVPTVTLRNHASLKHLVGVEERSSLNAVAEMSFL